MTKLKKRPLCDEDQNLNSETESIKSETFSSSPRSSISSTSSLLSTSSRCDDSDTSLFVSSSSASSVASSLSGDEEIIPLHDQKSKLKVFEKILSLISLLTEKNAQHQHDMHHDSVNGHTESLTYLKMNQKLKLNFFYKTILDDINLNHVKIILLSLIRINSCRYSHADQECTTKVKKKNQFFAMRFIDMCCKSIKRIQEKSTTENDRSIPFFNMLGNSCMGLLETSSSNQLTSLAVSTSGNLIEIENEDEITKQPTDCSNCLVCQENQIDFTPIIIDRLELLIESAPYHTLQWLASVCYANKSIQDWLLDNMSIWVKPLLIDQKQTNIRFSAAILLANLVPNRSFRETFTSNRNMLVPFKQPSGNNNNSSLLNMTANSTSNSSAMSTYNQTADLNYEFESDECKKVLHRIMKYLFSIIEELGQFVQTARPTDKTANG